MSFERHSAFFKHLLDGCCTAAKSSGVAVGLLPIQSPVMSLTKQSAAVCWGHQGAMQSVCMGNQESCISELCYLHVPLLISSTVLGNTSDPTANP